MKIFANIESQESFKYFSELKDKIEKIEMNSETAKSLSNIESDFSDWLKSKKIIINSTWGNGIICGYYTT